MTLPADVCRCVGRTSLRIDAEVCQQRHSCQRYMALVTEDRQPDRVPVDMWMCTTPQFEQRIPLEG